MKAIVLICRQKDENTPVRMIQGISSSEFICMFTIREEDVDEVVNLLEKLHSKLKEVEKK